MSTFEICIAFTSAILTIAYPIFVEVISRLDEKYDSIVITDLFNEEYENLLFTYSLYACIGLIIINLLELSPFSFLPQNSWIINHSALLLLAIASITLIVSFFYLIRKIFIYYRPLKLVTFLTKQHDQIVIKEETDYNNKYFSALSELLLYSVRKQNEKITKEISHFMYFSFRKIRENSNKRAVQYPAFYYDLSYKCIEELAGLKSKKLGFLENETAGSIFLFGELAYFKISDLTFSWIWSNQRLALKYDRDDFSLMHWENAHQYFDFILTPIQPDYLEFPKSKNQTEVEERERERDEFFIFHISLGALFLYLKKHTLLKKVFEYSQSLPPRYVLLPDTMDTIFFLLFKVVDDFDKDFNHLSFKYSFPDFSGVHADARIKEEIVSYLALLFLRQYSIIPYLVYQEPLRMPNPPETVGAKKRWLERLPYFKKIVSKHLQNTLLLSSVSLDFITNEYCKENNKKNPIELLEEFEAKIKASIEDAEVNQDISPIKSKKFISSTKEIMLRMFEEYKDLGHVRAYTTETASNFINGKIQMFDKSSFADDQGVYHANYDTFLAGQLAEKFRSGVSESFYFHKTEQYLINASQVNEAVDKLKIKGKGVALVGFGIKPEFFVDVKLFYSIFNVRLLGTCLFILKEADLPSIIYRDVKKEYQKDYELEKIDEKFNIYASVIDLNKNPHLHEELYQSGFEGDVKKQVLANIFVDAEIKWKKNIKCVMIQIASAYREQGIVSQLDDIKEF